MKRLIISLILGLVLILSVSGMALADDPTTVDVTWDGAGMVDGTVTAGDDAVAGFALLRIR